MAGKFEIVEATIGDIHDAYKSGALTARQLMQGYLERIAAFDKKGPAINCIINVDPAALENADRLDRALKSSGPVGPLHGIPLLIKDQIDAKGTPTTLGAKPLKDYYPERDAFIVDKLRKAGAIVFAKTTLGELGGGDTHGTLFGSTRNPYSLERTAGGSSGGTGAGISANFGAVGLGQEGFSSIRRPSAWNGIVGMRASGGLVSRAGSAGGWPGIAGSLGPMGRSVRDVATVLDTIVGYDPEDPLSALGVGHVPESYVSFLDRDGLRGARIGVIRESIGVFSEPESEDFAKVTRVFERAVEELRKTGATLVDPVSIPQARELLGKRTKGDLGGSNAAWVEYYGRSKKRPFESMKDLLAVPGYKPMSAMDGEFPAPGQEELYAAARLFFNLMKLMADEKLDAIVHKSVEHPPTLIRDGVNPPFVNTKGVIHVNTMVCYVPSISVPAGFASDGTPAGITFLGRPYTDAQMLKYAYAYEQATKHRRPPETTPALK